VKGKPLLIASVSVGVVLLVGIFFVALNLVMQQGARPIPGSPAPDFTLKLYPGYRAGLPEEIRLSDLRGNVVVINFWASWCVECHKEAQALEGIYRAYKDRGVVVLGVDYLDTEAPALAYLKQYNVTILTALTFSSGSPRHIESPACRKLSLLTAMAWCAKW